jgi:hypothetical protein
MISEKIVLIYTADVVIKDVPFGTVMKGKGSVKQGFIGFYASASDFKVQPKSQILKTGHLLSK